MQFLKLKYDLLYSTPFLRLPSPASYTSIQLMALSDYHRNNLSWYPVYEISQAFNTEQ